MKLYLDLFSGIGGFALAAYNADLRFNKHYFSEVDSYAISVYEKRFPSAENLGDIKNVNYGELPKGEWLVTGGFPCQPHSAVGRRQGADDKRDLWPECSRMLRDLQPRIALFENVTGLFTSPGKKRRGEYFNGLLSDLCESRYDAEWQVISASETGAPHQRKRIWIIAYSAGQRPLYAEVQQKSFRKKDTKYETEWKQLCAVSCGANKMENWEAYEYLLAGNDDGLSEGLDAIRCAGNAIVPQCAELIFNLPAFDLWRYCKNDT
jgi:DNA (cytosine-5)-methyltransferase 1